MAKPQCNQTHPKFQYRFLALSRTDRKARPCRLSVVAHSEREARQVLAPHFILSLAARLPLQGVEEISIPSTVDKTSTVREVRHA
ncbi:host cell division inhibitor Icd-like protein [Serratia liquefaciens]|uniref:host cell division inhibitor Icd-like protein n=1 Tax=Serratia liquefaciens TaxID=614 RepID=UPI003906D406